MEVQVWDYWNLFNALLITSSIIFIWEYAPKPGITILFGVAYNHCVTAEEKLGIYIFRLQLCSLICCTYWPKCVIMFWKIKRIKTLKLFMKILKFSRSPQKPFRGHQGVGDKYAGCNKRLVYLRKIKMSVLIYLEITLKRNWGKPRYHRVNRSLIMKQMTSVITSRWTWLVSAYLSLYRPAITCHLELPAVRGPFGALHPSFMWTYAVAFQARHCALF